MTAKGTKGILNMLGTRLNTDLTEAEYVSAHSDAKITADVGCTITAYVTSWEDKGLGNHLRKDVYGQLFFLFSTKAETPYEKIIDAKDELKSWVVTNYNNYTDGTTTVRTIELSDFRETPYNEGEFVKNGLMFEYWIEEDYS